MTIVLLLGSMSIVDDGIRSTEEQMRTCVDKIFFGYFFCNHEDNFGQYKTENLIGKHVEIDPETLDITLS
jgi:predicted oxidoreductase